MLVAGAAVGVATVFSAPFSGETLPRAPLCTLGPPLTSPVPWHGQTAPLAPLPC